MDCVYTDLCLQYPGEYETIADRIFDHESKRVRELSAEEFDQEFTQYADFETYQNEFIYYMGHISDLATLILTKRTNAQNYSSHLSSWVSKHYRLDERNRARFQEEEKHPFHYLHLIQEEAASEELTGIKASFQTKFRVLDDEFMASYSSLVKHCVFLLRLPDVFLKRLFEAPWYHPQICELAPLAFAHVARPRSLSTPEKQRPFLKLLDLIDQHWKAHVETVENKERHLQRCKRLQWFEIRNMASLVELWGRVSNPTAATMWPKVLQMMLELACEC